MSEKAYKYRAYPTKTQKELFAKTFGYSRYVYNHYLDMRITEYKNNGKSLSYYDNANDLKLLKATDTFLKEVDSIALQSSLRDLDTAYKNFFRLHTGFPKFKSKKTHRYSYKTKNVNNNIVFLGKYIKLPKIGNIRIKNKHIPQGRILNVTVSQEPSGKYYISVCCTDVNIQSLPKTNNNIGIDLGIKDFAILSNADKIPNPKYLQQNLDKLAKLQKRLSRKTKGSRNRNKARIKVARLQERISNQRKDFLQHLSTRLIRQYDIICMENLDVKDIMQKKDITLTNKQNSKNHRAVSDVSWSEFVRQTAYKCEWYGKELIRTDKYFPSSQLCSCCGYQEPKVKDLSVRSWTCCKCGTFHDRDINAAKNILAEGLRIKYA
jgi:putative transposase